MPNSDIGGSGVVTHFTDGLPQRWHLPLSLLLSGAGAPFSLLDSVGIGVPVTMSSSRERRQHWACVVLGSPLPCPLFQTEHFGSAPWNRPVATPYGRVPKRCIGGSGTSTGQWVHTHFATFAGVGVFLTRISAQANHAPLVLLPGHSQRQLGSSHPTCFRPELLNPSCTEDHSYALDSLAEELLCPFFRHLALVLLFSLLGLLMRPLKAHDTPLGGLVLLPTKGIPLGLLRPAALWSVSQNAVATQTASPLLPRGRRTCRPVHGAMPPRPGLFSLLRMWVWYYLFPCMPLQVWAAPASLREDIGANGRLDDSLPEHLGSTASLGAQTTLQDELHISMLQQSLHHDLTRPLENADALPVPPLHNVPEAGQPTASPLRGVCYAIAPQYQAEVLWLTLSLPLDLAAFNHAVREALRSLRLPFCYIIAPTVPQLGPDFASVVLAPKWLPQAGRQLIVHDFRPLGGPVYASITSDNVTHQDCEREAVSLGYRQTSIYVQGHSRAIEVGDTFLASLGGVIQYRPRGQPAEWCSTRHARFDRPRWWVPHSTLCWCLQLPALLQLEIISDCTSAIGITTGTQGGTCEDPLVFRCRSAMHLLQALRHPQDILVRHTRSHVGDPGNEVADALAKHACRGGGAIDAVILHDFAQAAARSSFAWLWLLVEATRRPGAWPTLQYQALWDDPSPLPELPTPDECASFFGLGGPPGHAPSGQAQATICACLLTVNVQTLYPQDGDIDSDSPPGAFIGRARFLRDQLQAKGIAITAVQETRSRQSETFISATHIRYASATPAELNYGSPGTTLSSTTGTINPSSFSLMISLPSTGTLEFLRSDIAGLPFASSLSVFMRPTTHPVKGTPGGLPCLGSFNGLPKAHTLCCLEILTFTLRGRTTRP